MIVLDVGSDLPMSLLRRGNYKQEGAAQWAHCKI